MVDADREPVYLVCTHGSTTRAARCAAGRSPRPCTGSGRAASWECTHVGGDRFAANVLVLPAGLLYGRVLPFAATEFAAAAEADEVVGALLRGRIGLPPAAQAALAFALRASRAAHAGRRCGVQAVSPVRDGVATVRLRGPHGLLDVAVRVERRRRRRADVHTTRPEPLPGLPPGRGDRGLIDLLVPGGRAVRAAACVTASISASASARPTQCAPSTLLPGSSSL